MAKGRPSTIPFPSDAQPSKPPACPEWLDNIARAKWAERLATEDGGYITDDDADLLAMYCDAWSRWLELRAKARDGEDGTDGGDILKGKNNGGYYFNPFAAARDRAQRTLAKLTKQLDDRIAARRKDGRVQRQTPPLVAVRDRSKGPPPPKTA